MPTLTNAGTLSDVLWEISGDPQTDSLPNKLVPADRWQAGVHTGLALDIDAEPLASYKQAERIGIHFPAFSDGRGLSLAVLLRTRYEFTGELRAQGDVHPDMLHYLRRCGFDSYELTNERNVDTAIKALTPYSEYYQGSVVEPEPKFRRA